ELVDVATRGDRLDSDGIGDDGSADTPYNGPAAERWRREAMEITLIGVPFAGDVMRWGNARAAQAWLDAGLGGELEGRGHAVAGPVWTELARGERSRDTITNLGRIAFHASHAVAEAKVAGRFPVVLAGDCTHSIGPVGGLARAGETPGVVWFDAHGDLHT